MKEVKDNSNISSEEKARKKYTISVIIICTLIISFCCFSVYYFNNKLKSNQKNATNNTCMMPYSTKNCKYARNETVKQIQKMLNNQGYYNKSYGYDGNFGPKTVAAVKDFQRSKGLGADGYVGPGTLEELAKATNTAYFKIKYDKAGGTGSLNSQYNNTQVILNGINTKISSTTLRKSGYTHVGYTVTSTIGTTKYRYGCFNKNCSSGSKAYTEAQIKANKNTFYDVVYSIGVGVSQTGWETGQTITFTAKYCPSGQTYDKKTSSCVKSGSYNKTAQLTGYGVDCCGGHGKVACYDYMPKKQTFSSSVYTYNDSEYGNVRVVAMKLNSKKTDCGTIIEIENYKEGSTTKNTVKAIVLDTGVGSGVIDLLVTSERYALNNIGIQKNIKYKVLRQGFAK